MTLFELLEIEQVAHLRADHHASWRDLLGTSALLVFSIILAVMAIIA